MAASTLSPETGWHKVRREVRPGKFIPYVKLRVSGAVYLSTDFVKTANIEGMTRASVYISADGYKLGFRFHSEEDDDSFQLAKDGGSNRGSSGCGRVLQAKLAKRSHLVAAAISRGDDMRYVPK